MKTSLWYPISSWIRLIKRHAFVLGENIMMFHARHPKAGWKFPSLFPTQFSSISALFEDASVKKSLSAYLCQTNFPFLSAFPSVSFRRSPHRSSATPPRSVEITNAGAVFSFKVHFPPHLINARHQKPAWICLIVYSITPHALWPVVSTASVDQRMPFNRIFISSPSSALHILLLPLIINPPFTTVVNRHFY